MQPRKPLTGFPSDGLRGGATVTRGSIAVSRQALVDGGGGASADAAMQRYRRSILQKRHVLCAHFTSDEGCALGAMCPYRHVGASEITPLVAVQQQTSSSNTHDTASTFLDTCTTVRSSQYAGGLNPEAQGRMMWFWLSLPATAGCELSVSGTAPPMQWRPFHRDMEGSLEAAYLVYLRLRRTAAALSVADSAVVETSQRCHIGSGGAYTADFNTMTLQVAEDGGYRRAIQRVEVMPSPAWYLEPVPWYFTSESEPLQPTSATDGHGGSATAEVKPVQKPMLLLPQVIDPIAASCLEYHYCHAKRNLLTIGVHDVVLRCNLLSMTGAEVRERRRTLSSVVRGRPQVGKDGKMEAWKTAVQMVVNTMRLHGGGSGSHFNDRSDPHEGAAGDIETESEEAFAALQSNGERRQQSARAIAPLIRGALLSSSSAQNGNAAPNASTVAKSSLDVRVVCGTGRDDDNGEARSHPRQYQLVRQSVTIRSACPPSNPYGHSGLRFTLTLRDAVDGDPLWIAGTDVTCWFDDVRRQSQQAYPSPTCFATTGLRYLQSQAKVMAPAALNVNDIDGQDKPLRGSCVHSAAAENTHPSWTGACAVDSQRCGMDLKCKWESGRHLWRESHTCPNGGRRGGCMWCSFVVHPLRACSLDDEDGRAAMAPLKWISQRSRIHQRLFEDPSVHDVASGKALQRVPSALHASALTRVNNGSGGFISPAAAAAAVEQPEADVVIWRRLQSVSRSFRSYWETATAVTGAATTTAAGGAFSTDPELHYVPLTASEINTMVVPCLTVSSGDRARCHPSPQTAIHGGSGAMRRRSSTYTTIEVPSLASTSGSPLSLSPSSAKDRAHADDAFNNNSITESPPLSSPSGAAAPHGPELPFSLHQVLDVLRRHRQQVERVANLRSHSGGAEGRQAIRGLSTLTLTPTATPGAADDHPPVVSVQRIQDASRFQNYIAVRNERLLLWMAYERDGALRSNEEVLFRLIPRSWLHRCLHGRAASAFAHDLRYRACAADAGGGTSELERRWMADANQLGWWMFYRDLSSALEEPLPPGVEYVLLVSMAFIGASVRMSRVEAERLAAPPLVVPWHLNQSGGTDRSEDEEEDAVRSRMILLSKEASLHSVRMYRPYDSVVCDTLAPAPAVVMPSPSESGGGGDRGKRVPLSLSSLSSQQPPSLVPLASSPSFSSSVSPPQPSSIAVSPPPKLAVLTSPSQTAPSDTDPSSVMRAKQVYLYDLMQWYPMYVIAVQ